MKIFHNAATKHYILSGQMFHSSLVRSPALFFISKTDPVGTFASNQRVRERWESLGISCTWKCWDKSPHVGHFHKHKEEYIATWFEYLRSINMIGCSDNINWESSYWSIIESTVKYRISQKKLARSSYETK